VRLVLLGILAPLAILESPDSLVFPVLLGILVFLESLDTPVGLFECNLKLILVLAAQ
jgi:hypothetical protein